MKRREGAVKKEEELLGGGQSELGVGALLSAQK